MLQPNDLPLLCLPIDLSDEAAAKLVEFLHELTAALERHYCAQLKRYYHPTDIAQRDLDRAPESTDPPFQSRNVRGHLMSKSRGLRSSVRQSALTPKITRSK